MKSILKVVVGIGAKGLMGLMTLGLMMAIPAISQAIPGAKVLVVDNPNHKVIEIEPFAGGGTITWEYGGSPTLNYPNEAIPLTNGNILIADTYNGRIIEVTSDTRQIVWSYSTRLSKPVDVKRCIDYTTGTPRDTLLITDLGIGFSKVMEVTYPGGVVVWELDATDIGGTGDYIFWEAEKRPGAGTPTCLITCRSHTNQQRVMEIQNPGSLTLRQITWKYTDLTDPRDANWTPCGNVLITDPGTKTVIEVDPNTNNVVWQYPSTLAGGYIPLEAIRIENNNTLIVASIPPNPWDWDDNKDGKYPDNQATSNYTDVREIQGDTVVWQYSQWYGSEYSTTKGNAFVDVEEKGIINIAKIVYADSQGKSTKTTFAGVVVPILQPEVIAPPYIVATKIVDKVGPQAPGAILTYTIVLTNTTTLANGTATNVVVIDQVPPGTVYDGHDGSGADVFEFSENGGITWKTTGTPGLATTHLRWTYNQVGPNETRTIQFSVKIKE